MKPAWDKLMDDFAGNPNSLVADVDCDGTGKDLCETHGIEGFPTIKWGDAGDMKKYEGARSYEALKKFAEENLGPQCGPGENIGLCSDKVKKQIEKYLAMGADELEAKIDKAMDKVNVDMPFMNKALAYVKVQEAGGPEAMAALDAAAVEKSQAFAGKWENEGMVIEISMNKLKAKMKVVKSVKGRHPKGSQLEGKASGLSVTWDMPGKTMGGSIKEDGTMVDTDGKVWTRQVEEAKKDEKSEL